jgi:hypothetical protein
MNINLADTESVAIQVQERTVPIQHYLRQPQRLVNAIANPNLTEQLGKELFLIKMRPIDFMMYHFQPVVTLRVWADADGTVHLRSQDCEIRGNRYINDRFSLSVAGQLSPTQANGQTVLQGKADLEVGVELPPALEFTPRPFLESTGKSLLRGVLQRIKNRLSSQLLSDYYQWANHSAESTSSASASTLSPAENPTS